MVHPPRKRSVTINLLLLVARGVVVFLFLAIAYLFYERTITRALTETSIITSFLLVWLFTAYFFLPRVHRFLTRLYLPDYYIGRTKTPDGLLADPINLAVIGSREQLINAMTQAGWEVADPTTPQTVLRIIKAAALKQSYARAPISSLMLFDRKQDLAFQKEVRGNPRARRHVRFWQVPPEWFLPGGRKADWLGAATFDKSVGISLFTGQITHKIDEDTDKERDLLVTSLRPYAKIEMLPHFTTAYHHRNGGGDSIRTDGSMPFISLR